MTDLLSAVQSVLYPKAKSPVEPTANVAKLSPRTPRTPKL